MPHSTSRGQLVAPAPEGENPDRQAPSLLPPSPGHKPGASSCARLDAPPIVPAGLTHPAIPGRSSEEAGGGVSRTFCAACPREAGAQGPGGVWGWPLANCPQPQRHQTWGGPTLCHVSCTMPALSARISMSRWASPSLSTMLPTAETSVL